VRLHAVHATAVGAPPLSAALPSGLHRGRCAELADLLGSACEPANSITAALPRMNALAVGLAARSTVAPDRGAAMRKPKDPAANRASIIAAAIDEFAQRGFKGASMDAIAARTRTTRALINYYFGSKETLYISVLEQVYAQIREAESQLALDHLAPADAMRRIVEFSFDYYLAHEDFVRLIVAENQANGRHLKKSATMRALNRPIIDRVASVIARGQAQGTFRPDAAPVDVYMAVAALGIFNVTNRYTFSTIFEHQMGAQGNVAKRRDFIATLILGYLTNFPR
jgi:AcrR family transcriptional regulator